MSAPICRRCSGTGREPDARAIGTSVRRLREASGRSLRDVAEALGITASYLCDLELGRRLLSAQRLAQVRKELSR